MFSLFLFPDQLLHIFYGRLVASGRKRLPVVIMTTGPQWKVCSLPVAFQPLLFVLTACEENLPAPASAAVHNTFHLRIVL